MSMFKEKSGVEVMVVGKRVVVYDSKANKVGQLKLNHYEWPITEPKANTHYGVI